MTRFIERFFATRDARGGLLLLLAVVILLAYLALAALSFRLIERLLVGDRANILHDADGRRWYFEQQLGQAQRLQPLEAARVVGPKLLAADRPELVREELARFGMA